jgi:hypothetical protein
MRDVGDLMLECMPPYVLLLLNVSDHLSSTRIE